MLSTLFPKNEKKVNCYRIFQFTKNSEVLTIEEKRHFSALFSGNEDDVDKVIRFAQLEKQVMEGTIAPEAAAKVVDGFSAVMGMVGTYAIAYWSAVFAPLGLFVPIAGPFAMIGAASVFLSNYVTSKKNQKIEDTELRKKLFSQVVSSYHVAKTVAQNESHQAYLVALEEEPEHIAKATGYTLPKHITNDDQKEKISALITNFLHAETSFGKVAANLKGSDLQKMLSQVALQGANDDPSEIIGIYDISLSNCITGNFSGILIDEKVNDEGGHGRRVAERLADLGFSKSELLALQFTQGDVDELFEEEEDND